MCLRLGGSRFAWVQHVVIRLGLGLCWVERRNGVADELVELLQVETMIHQSSVGGMYSTRRAADVHQRRVRCVRQIGELDVKRLNPHLSGDLLLEHTLHDRVEDGYRPLLVRDEVVGGKLLRVDGVEGWAWLQTPSDADGVVEGKSKVK